MLVIGFLGGDHVIQLVFAFDAMHPAIDVDFALLYWSGQPWVLLDDHQIQQVTAQFPELERRARDSNPGGAFLPLAVFKTAAIGH